MTAMDSLEEFGPREDLAMWVRDFRCSVWALELRYSFPQMVQPYICGVTFDRVVFSETADNLAWNSASVIPGTPAT